MAKALLDKVLGGIEREEGTPAYEIIEEYKGKDLEYKEYEPLYQCAKDCADKQHKKAFFVYCDNYVTMEDGTGIVHIDQHLVKTMPELVENMTLHLFRW